MRFLVVLSLLLAAVATSAGAADLGGDNRISLKDEPRYVSRFNWTGAYGGAQIGYGWADIQWLTINAMKSAFWPFDRRLALIEDVIKPAYDPLLPPRSA